MTSLRRWGGWYWLSLLLPAGALLAFALRSPWSYLLVVISVVLFADAAMGQDQCWHRSSSRGMMGSPHVPLAFMAAWITAGAVGFARAIDSSMVDLFGYAISTGFLSAFAMAHVHEVMHRGGRLIRRASSFALCVAGYPHYRVVHQLHHAHVGDPRYGSTASRNTSIWRHVPRSFAVSLCAACDVAPTSDIVRAAMPTVALLGIAAYVGGPSGAPFYLGQSMVSIFVVEGIGYLQHYGLTSSEASDRGDLPVAWNVTHWLSNRLFVNNGLHTHHHLEQTATFDQLLVRGPALPGGYLHMFIVALFPPLWFRMMAPLFAECLPENCDLEQSKSGG